MLEHTNRHDRGVETGTRSELNDIADFAAGQHGPVSIMCVKEARVLIADAAITARPAGNRARAVCRAAEARFV